MAGSHRAVVELLADLSLSDNEQTGLESTYGLLSVVLRLTAVQGGVTLMPSQRSIGQQKSPFQCVKG